MKLTTQDKILNALNIVRYATAYNLEPWFYKTAETLEGRLQTPYRTLLILEKKGLIKPVKITPPVDELKKHNKFYTPVESPIESIAEVKLRHESGIADLILSFIFLYADFDVRVRYRPIIKYGNKKHYEPDAVVTLDPFDKAKHSYTYIIEFERTREPKELLEKIDFITSLGNLSKLGFPDFTRVLFVVSHQNYKGYWRPSEYQKPEVKKQIDQVEARFVALMKKARKAPDSFRFMHFPDFHRLNEPVWFTPVGKRVKLIL